MHTFCYSVLACFIFFYIIVVNFDNIIYVINLIEGHIHSEDAMWLFAGIHGRYLSLS